MIDASKPSLSLLLFFLFVGPAKGLWLGDLTVNSHLGEPLRGQLILEETGDIGQSEIVVRVADKLEYERRDIFRQDFLEDIKFEFLLSNEVNDSLIVSTELPIDISSFDLILQVNWNQQQAFNKYRVEIKPDPQALNQLLPGLRYRVSANETLWSISKKISTEDVSVYQAMRGIQRLNPNAFLEGDANSLIANAIILLPTRDDLFGDGEAKGGVNSKTDRMSQQSYSSEDSITIQGTIQRYDKSEPILVSSELSEIDKQAEVEFVEDQISSSIVADEVRTREELIEEIYILYETIRELESDLKIIRDKESELESELKDLNEKISSSLYINYNEIYSLVYEALSAGHNLLDQTAIFALHPNNRLKVGLGLFLTLCIFILVFYLTRKNREYEDQARAEFNQSARNLDGLNPLAKPSVSFKDVIEDIESRNSLENGESKYMPLTGQAIDNTNLEEVVHAEEANPISSKLDLARAYIDMGEVDMAGPLLDEILEEGSDSQVDEARALIARLKGL